nr:hypothetical protein [Actinomadura madurae]
MNSRTPKAKARKTGCRSPPVSGHSKGPAANAAPPVWIIVQIPNTTMITHSAAPSAIVTFAESFTPRRVIT